MQLTGLHHVTLISSDLGRSIAFYRDTLGLQVKGEHGEWAELDADGLTIGLNAREGEEPGPEGGAVLAFRADGSLEDEVSRLQGQGIDFPGGISEFPWGRIAAFHDPDGNSLELYEPPSS